MDIGEECVWGLNKPTYLDRKVIQYYTLYTS
jgi:hypothetical protein